MKNFLKTFIFLFVLQSCSSLERYNEKHDSRLSKHFPKGSGIVIVKVNAKQEKIFRGEELVSNRGFVEMNWRKYSENPKCRETKYSRLSLQILNSDDSEESCKKTLHLNPYKKKLASNEYEAYLVEEGMYFLQRIRDVPLGWFTEDFFTSLIGRPYRYGFVNIEQGWNEKLNKPNFASFEVKAGEVTYVGDLDFTFTWGSQKFLSPRKAKVNLVIQNNFSEAKKYFFENFPEFKNMPLITRLVEPGILLDDYEAGMIFYQ